MTMAKVQSKQKDYDKALELVMKVWEIAESDKGSNSEAVGNSFLEMAKLYAKKKDVD